jgi:hypothetical protein
MKKDCSLVKKLVYESYIEYPAYPFLWAYSFNWSLRVPCLLTKLLVQQSLLLFLARVGTLQPLQGRNHEKMLAATSAMVGRICPPWSG